MKKIAILGSTGSIGTQTLDVVRANGDIEVVGISAGSNITLLEQQIREFHPKFAAVGDEAKAAELRNRVKDLDVKIGCGMDGMIELATMPESEILVTAIVGMIGIRPTIAAMKAGKDIALANKETLVTAGHIIMPLAKECGVQILPVDSEHSAIFQCLHGENRKEIEKLLITVFGGPFRGKTRAELGNVTVEQALCHPNWSMGHKITIDSATLVNKGLEVMEAKWLFGVDLDHIQVVVQPKSIIHSMVEFKDGAVMAQLGTPDMKLPIQYALYYPSAVSLRETVSILRLLRRLRLKSRIWRLSLAFRWQCRHPGWAVLCRRFSTRRMSVPLRCSWQRRSVFLRSTMSLPVQWKHIKQLPIRRWNRSLRRSRRRMNGLPDHGSQGTVNCNIAGRYKMGE